MTYPDNSQGGQPSWDNSGGYQGFGLYSGQPPGPPPRKNRTGLIIGLVLGLVAVVGAVAVILVINHKDDSTTADPGKTSSAPPTTTTTTTKSTGPAGPTATNPGWTVIKNTDLLFAYEVPPGWTTQTTPAPSKALPAASLNFVAALTPYPCAGSTYSRGVVGSFKLPKGGIDAALLDVANKLGNEYYNSATSKQVQVGQPTPVTRSTSDGTVVKGSQIDTIVTTSGSECLATKGKLTVLALESPNDFVVLVVNGDLEGGPASPPCPADADLRKIVESARPDL